MSREEIRAELKKNKMQNQEELTQLYRLLDNTEDTEFITITVGCGGAFTVICCE